jgi:Tol biopolymer transport system component
VSRDGSTIAFTAVTGSPDQREGVLVATGTARPDIEIVEPAPDITYDSSMMTLSSDGKRVLVAYDDRLVLRNASVDPDFGPGEVIATLTKQELLGKSPYFPEFSFDDAAVVLTLSDRPDSAIAVQSGDIAVLRVDLVTSSFEPPEVVVPGDDDEFHFYPTWSPDGEYIAFASAPREMAEDGFMRKSYDQKKARLRLVHKDGGDIYELTRATHAANSWSTFPKFAPFQDGDLMYLTFNSKIDYGLVVDNTSRPDRDKSAQLWMSAIDVGQLPEDPSSAPMWLPFQDSSQSSHLGIWTNDVKCRLDVSGNGCPVGQECDTATKTCRVRVK